MRKRFLAIGLILIVSVTSTVFALPPQKAHFTGPSTDNVFVEDTQYDQNLKPQKNTRVDKNSSLTPPPTGVYGGNVQTEFINPLYDNEPHRKAHIELSKSKYATEAEEVIAMINNQGLDDKGRPYKKLTPTTGLIKENDTYGIRAGGENKGGPQSLKLEADAYGKIGKVSIPAIGYNINVYNNAGYRTMFNGFGVIHGTSMWDGNVGIAGHNRGSRVTVAKIAQLNIGDKVTYTTNAGVRTYSVTEVKTISQTDTSDLDYTTHNQITMITCVANKPNLRTCVIATEVY